MHHLLTSADACTLHCTIAMKDFKLHEISMIKKNTD